MCYNSNNTTTETAAAALQLLRNNQHTFSTAVGVTADVSNNMLLPPLRAARFAGAYMMSCLCNQCGGGGGLVLPCGRQLARLLQGGTFVGLFERKGGRETKGGSGAHRGEKVRTGVRLKMKKQCSDSMQADSAVGGAAAWPGACL